MGGEGDNTTIRFRTDNPGPWFLHCHIDWHLDACVSPASPLVVPFLTFSLYSGFAVVFAEAMPETKQLKVPRTQLPRSDGLNDSDQHARFQNPGWTSAQFGTPFLSPSTSGSGQNCGSVTCVSFSSHRTFIGACVHYKDYKIIITMIHCSAQIYFRLNIDSTWYG